MNSPMTSDDGNPDYIEILRETDKKWGILRAQEYENMCPTFAKHMLEIMWDIEHGITPLIYDIDNLHHPLNYWYDIVSLGTRIRTWWRGEKNPYRA